jgi:hypothetical protein
MLWGGFALFVMTFFVVCIPLPKCTYAIFVCVLWFVWVCLCVCCFCLLLFICVPCLLLFLCAWLFVVFCSLFFQTIGLGETRWHHYSSCSSYRWKWLSKRIFSVESPCFYLFTGFPVVYLNWYIVKFSAPAIFHCFIRPRRSTATRPSVFNLLWQKISCSESGLVLWVISWSSDYMPQ